MNPELLIFLEGQPCFMGMAEGFSTPTPKLCARCPGQHEVTQRCLAEGIEPTHSHCPACHETVMQEIRTYHEAPASHA